MYKLPERKHFFFHEVFPYVFLRRKTIYFTFKRFPCDFDFQYFLRMEATILWVAFFIGLVVFAVLCSCCCGGSGKAGGGSSWSVGSGAGGSDCGGGGDWGGDWGGDDGGDCGGDGGDGGD